MVTNPVRYEEMLTNPERDMNVLKTSFWNKKKMFTNSEKDMKNVH